jgi:cytochrome c553
MNQNNPIHGAAVWSTVSLVLLMMLAVSSTASSQQSAGGDAQIQRGQYLVGITGCHDCHSPKVSGMTPDMTRSLSGRPATTPLPSPTKDEIHASLDLTAWTGPWGFSVASNLTPDPATGIGTRYNEASFITAMRTGKKPNGTQMQPPMPQEVYQNMTDDDLRAIWAYLRTVKPIRNAVMAGLQLPAPGTQKP